MEQDTALLDIGGNTQQMRCAEKEFWIPWDYSLQTDVAFKRMQHRCPQSEFLLSVVFEHFGMSVFSG